MNREEMLAIAERNIKKAKRALDMNQNRPGITDTELSNLVRNALYAENVYRLIYAEYWDE